MTDSYLGPTDLADARRRIEDAAARRGRVGGAENGTVVRLQGRWAEDRMWSLESDVRCVVADMALWSADVSSLEALADGLAPGGTLLFLEPTADLGWRSVLHRFGSRLWRLRYGHHFETDVPAQLRAAGFVVTTTDRFGLGPRGIRSYVWGEAMAPAQPGEARVSPATPRRS